MNTPRSLTSTELQARTDAALELARIVAGLNPHYLSDDGYVKIGRGMFAKMQAFARRALGSTPELDAEFSRFLNWARSEGKDSAHTFDTDRNQWIALNPATADLWRAWRVAAGVPASEYLAKIKADPRRAAALQRARDRAPGGVATDGAVCRLCLTVTGGRQCFEPACPGGVTPPTNEQDANRG